MACQPSTQCSSISIENGTLFLSLSDQPHPMIKFFRKIRQRLLSENRFSKYLLYAFGEIVLVVIGILIALQINNWNEHRKSTEQELKYLRNLKADLQFNIAEIDRYVETRNSRIESAYKVLEYYEGKPLEDLNDLNFHTTNVYIWYKFMLEENTYQELVNSGNLAIISDDSIKSGLLDLQTRYRKLKNEEDHYRYDTEVLLYEPAYEMLDMDPLMKNYAFRASNGQAGEDVQLSRPLYENMLRSMKHKNGFVMAIYEHTVMNGQLTEMKDLCGQLVELIDGELNKYSK